MILRKVLCLTVLGLLCLAYATDVDCSAAEAQVSCKTCINGTLAGKCAWCKVNDTCLSYNTVTDITFLKGCGKDFYASNCVVSHKLVIVGVAIASGLVALLLTALTIWCCCCRGRKARKRKLVKDEAEYQAQRDAISTKHEASRAERQEKHDAIRMKYGLKKSNPYERFD